MTQHTWITQEKNRKYQTLAYLVLPILVIGVWTGANFLFLMGLFISALLLSVHYYLRSIHKPIELDIGWTRKRLFPGENSELQLQVSNHGQLPIQGKWLFKLHKNIELANIQRDDGEIYHLYPSLFSIQRKETYSYQFAGQALKRGVISVHYLLVEFTDPFALGKASKEFVLPRNEVLIYPELKPVLGIDQLQKAPMGERSVNRYTHEDPSYIVGMRTYQYGDPFQRIDWKTTARKQELHTRLLDRTAHTELVIIGNVRTAEERWMGVNEEIVERSISGVASICHHATLQDIPYQVVLNMRPKSRNPVYQINRGEGRKHLSDTLEKLARVNILSSISFEAAVNYAYQDYSEGKIIVLVTSYVSEYLQKLLTRMRNEGISVFIVNTSVEGFVLQRVGSELKRYA